MGSSSRPKSSRACSLPPAKPSRVKDDLCDALHLFSEALAIVETVSRALLVAQNDPVSETIGAEVTTLQQGVRALVFAYEEIDRAISRVAS